MLQFVEAGTVTSCSTDGQCVAVRVTRFCGLALFASALSTASALPQVRQPDQIAEGIRRRIEMPVQDEAVAAGSHRIFASSALPRFYLQRAFQPAWSGDGRLLRTATQVLRSLEAADAEGLDPKSYHLVRIHELLSSPVREQDAPRLVELDLLLTDAYLVYAAHLLAGRVNPETIDSEWHATRRELDFAQFLEAAIESGDPAGALRTLLPEQDGYRRLKQALARYRAVAAQGGWGVIGEGPQLSLGQNDPRVPSLRRRLTLTADVETINATDSTLLDQELAEALKRFQIRHGLDADGVLGTATLSALNVPVVDRIRQIELNLERWRWLPQHLGDRHIIVNIAAFELEVFEDRQPVLAMPVIVGRPYRRTPVFSGAVSYLVFSPYWHVPHALAVQDQLPMQQRDPAYFRRVGMRVFEGWGTDAKQVDPATVDWTSVTPPTFHYRLRQDPGPANALGAVKFMFPNKHSVYLHDTPVRDLFAKSQRDFSSGCIRVENAAALAEYLLRGTPPWDAVTVAKAMSEGVERTVPLTSRLLVHILYWTAWANEDGSIHFRRDIYARDDKLAAALATPPF